MKTPPKLNRQIGRGYELRYDDPEIGGALDEVIAFKPELVHFEVMSDQSIWCGITLADKREIRIWISSKNGKSHIGYTAEVQRQLRPIRKSGGKK